MNDVRATRGRAIGPEARPTGPAPPLSAVQANVIQVIGLLRSLSAHDPTIHRPARAPVPPAEVVTRYLASALQRRIAGSGVRGEAARFAHAAIERVAEGLAPPVETLLATNAAGEQLYRWALAQTAHNMAVEDALVRGLVTGLERELRQGYRSQLIERGEFDIAFHLGVAAGSMHPGSPAGLLFWTSAVGHWVTQGVADYYGLLRLAIRQDELAVLLLHGAHVALSYAFSPTHQAIAQAQELGGMLAHSFRSELFDALFPTLGTVTVFGAPLEEVAGIGPRFVAAALPHDIRITVDRTVSPLLVPWTLGAFVGPILVDVAVSILLPEGALLRAAMTTVQRFPRVWAIVRRLGRLAANIPGASPSAPTGAGHVPSPPAVTDRALATGLDDAARGLDVPGSVGPASGPTAPAAVPPTPAVNLPRGPVSDGIALAAQGRRAVASGASLTAEARKLAERFAQIHSRKLAGNPETIDGLAGLFERMLQDPSSPFAGEMVTIERYLRDPSVRRVKVIPQSRVHGVKSQDLEVRYSGGALLRVEIKTLTTSPVGPGDIWWDILTKVKKKQMAGRPGAIVLVVEHPPNAFEAVADAAMERIRESIRKEAARLRYQGDSDWRNIRRIEIVPAVRTPLIFDRVRTPVFFRLRLRRAG